MTAATRLQTFLVADLAGYSALTEAHGDEEAADAALAFCEAVRALLPAHAAEEIKALGDALLVRTDSPAGAADLAERIVCGYGTRHRGLGIRVGIHSGTAVQRGGDWFGSAVNVAARVADVAGAGEVLLTGAARAGLPDPSRARPRGRRAFKNIAEPVELFELALTEAPARPLAVDPVCRMTLHPELAVEHRAHAGMQHHFCSTECAALFDANPGGYV